MAGRLLLLAAIAAAPVLSAAWNPPPQLPLENVLKRVSIPSKGDLRGLVDIIGFPQSAGQMDLVGNLCEELEKPAISTNQVRYSIMDGDGLVCAISPHDDYMLAGRVYAHVHRYMKARTVILVGNAHWSEAFGIRDRLIFGDFKNWRGPYGPVPVSSARDRILAKLDPASYTVNRKLVETEHSLEAMVPYLQFYNRKVEIIPVLVPLSSWQTLDRLGRELSRVVADLAHGNHWKLGTDIAILCSSDGQHYGDYGWSYYDYHPFGCDAAGYQRALALDETLISTNLTGRAASDRVHNLFNTLVDQEDISRYRITWCGRFATPFGVNFAIHLTRALEDRDLNGFLLRTGSSLSDPWLPVKNVGLGVTADANLHHFVTYFSVGYK